MTLLMNQLTTTSPETLSGDTSSSASYELAIIRLNAQCEKLKNQVARINSTIK